MTRCLGPQCGRRIAFVQMPAADGGRVTVPVDLPLRQRATLEDGRRVWAVVLHHSTCPDAAAFRKAHPRKKEAPDAPPARKG